MTESQSQTRRPCSAIAQGPFIGTEAAWLHCGDIEGHDGAHYFHVEWGDTTRPRWINASPSCCEHRADPTYNGRWCAICNPEFGGDRGAGI